MSVVFERCLSCDFKFGVWDFGMKNRLLVKFYLFDQVVFKADFTFWSVLLTGKTGQISCPEKFIDLWNCIFLLCYKAENWAKF